MTNLSLIECLPNNRASSHFKLAYDKFVLFTNSHDDAEGLSVTRDFQKVRYKLPL